MSFVSLQLQGAARELPSPSVYDAAAEIRDWDDTAAIIAQLDLVITIDTAVAHLAGAMGKPVWTLVHYSSDWRWGLSGESTPWYPSMRLFRQQRLGDWSLALHTMTSQLVGKILR